VQAPGDDHRLTVVNGRMIAAAKRIPATITGDGTSTVRQLIDALNTDPRRGRGYEKLMVLVPIDARLETLLGQQGLSLDAVPEAGREVKASLAGNISQGGTAIDVTDMVHPDNRLAAELAARSCYALVAGVDFMSSDISKSWRDGDGWVLEVNTSPGLRPHWIANPQQDVVTPILRVAFPEGAPARVPTAGITGSIGKSTTCQMLAQIARQAGRHPGLTTTQGTWSGDVQLKRNDWAGGTSAVDLLSDPLVDISIAELARGGLLKKGMVLDGVDVAAVLNLTSNHVGIDGIETREDLAKIKAIPVRRARQWVFLNADEPLVLTMREVMEPGVKLGLVSPNPKSAALVAHRKAGGCTVTLEGKGKNAKIAIRQGEDLEFEMKVAAIPASDAGASAAIAENAMFASAVALRLGLGGEDIAAALAGFKSDFSQNPGRHNVVEGLPFDVLLTWADGPEPIDELMDYLAQRRTTGPRYLYMIGPGNRSDEWIAATGKHAAAGKFDRYWAADMNDLRGREPGAVPELIARGLVEGGADDAAIIRLPGDERALTPVLEQIEPGAHLTVMAFDTLALLREMEAFRERLEQA
jgi:cyanophycin synthetase